MHPGELSAIISILQSAPLDRQIQRSLADLAIARSVLVDLGAYTYLDRRIQANIGELAIPFERSSRVLEEVWR
jgi:hypothetical protein